MLGAMAKYDPLFEHLCRAGDRDLVMTFDEIDELVGGLPGSARKLPAWWSGEPQAKAWRNAGRELESVDRVAARVRFSAPRWTRGS